VRILKALAEFILFSTLLLAAAKKWAESALLNKLRGLFLFAGSRRSRNGSERHFV